jgi:integrase
MANRDARPLPINALSALHDAAIEEIYEGNERWGIPILLGLHTGLRRSEIAHFTDNWIDEENGGREIKTPKLVECKLEEGGCRHCNSDGSGGPAGNAREGEIHIRKTKGAGEKRVRKDVGDYIEFEEVPATETDKNDPDKQ